MAFNLSTASTTKQRPIDSIEWTRPGDWVSITSVPDNEIYYLVADMGLKTFRINTTFTRTASQNIYIDWGDGTTTTISSPELTGSEKTYTTGGTPCSRGYNTYRIRIYGDAGTTITGAAFAKATVYNRDNYPIYLLEAWFGNGVDINLAGYFSSVSFNYQILEYVKLPSTYLGTSFNKTFRNNFVQKVDMPTSAPNLTDIGSMFTGAVNITTIIFPADATNINGSGGSDGFTGPFSSCTSLTTLQLPPTLNNAVEITYMFSGCRSLKSINMPTMPNCIDFLFTFQNCSSLTFVELKPLPTTGALQFISTFTGCSSLENVKLPPVTGTATVSSMANMFVSCISLIQFKLPSGWDTPSLSLTFSGCNSLQKVELLPSMPSLTNLQQTFASCTALTEVILPTTVAASGISVATAFSSCSSISKITIPSSWILSGTLQNMFNSCFNLIQLDFPANAQNSITTMLNTFQNCNRLKVVTMPTSMTGLTSLQSTFQGCGALETIVLPSALNSVTTMVNTFNGCFSLRSVTMPTSMSALTNYGTVFQNCSSIKNITMPATISASLTTASSAFNSCFNLETVTLPTTQTTLLNNVTFMFAQCFSLKTINNVDKLGSSLTTGLVAVSYTHLTLPTKRIV